MNKLIVFLGNPGREYAFTRHNISWLLSEHLKFNNKLIWKEKFKGEYAQLNHKGAIFYFLKPLTYMNLSGESIRALMSFFKISISDILVVHDEMDFSFGTISFKNGGGLAGHNGLKSTAELCGGNGFLRLRMGIDRPTAGDCASWVLGKFGLEEQQFLDEYLTETAKAIDFYMNHEFKKVINKYNKKNMITR